jgi:hypothetical protein
VLGEDGGDGGGSEHMREKMGEMGHRLVSLSPCRVVLVSLSLCSNKRWLYFRHGHPFDHRYIHRTQDTSASPETAKQNCMPRLLDLYRATRTRRTHQENASGKASHDPKIARGYPNCTQQQSEHPIVIRVSTILILRRLQNSEKKQGCSRISIV